MSHCDDIVLPPDWPLELTCLTGKSISSSCKLNNLGQISCSISFLIYTVGIMALSILRALLWMFNGKVHIKYLTHCLEYSTKVSYNYTFTHVPLKQHNNCANSVKPTHNFFTLFLWENQFWIPNWDTRTTCNVSIGNFAGRCLGPR